MDFTFYSLFNWEKNISLRPIKKYQKDSLKKKGLEYNFLYLASFRCLGHPGCLASFPWKSGVFLFGLDHALILKLGIMTMGSSASFGGVHRVVYKFKLVYRFAIVYNFKVVHRVMVKLSLHDHISLLSQYFCHSPFYLLPLTQLCLKVKCHIDFGQCLAQRLMFHLFPKRSDSSHHEYEAW
jgi:hypothetical protein